MKLKPNRHPLVETRLIWMRDNQPHTLLELWNNKTLQEQVVKQVQEAAHRYWTLIDQGVDKWTAQELRLNELAPAEGMEIEREEVINDSLFERIVDEVMS